MNIGSFTRFLAAMACCMAMAQLRLDVTLWKATMMPSPRFFTSRPSKFEMTARRSQMLALEIVGPFFAEASQQFG
jgi:hypothetical protein